MRLITNTTELIGIKDQNIIISLVFEKDTHTEIQAKLDYPAPSRPHCHGMTIKDDFQNLLKFLFLSKRELQHYYVLKSVASSVKIVGKSR
jgi:hypothetical protein